MFGFFHLLILPFFDYHILMVAVFFLLFSLLSLLPVSIRVRISSAVRGKYLSSSGHACSGILAEGKIKREVGR